MNALKCCKASMLPFVCAGKFLEKIKKKHCEIMFVIFMLWLTAEKNFLWVDFHISLQGKVLSKDIAGKNTLGKALKRCFHTHTHPSFLVMTSHNLIGKAQLAYKQFC